MKRPRFNLLASASLAMLAYVVVLWCRSLDQAGFRVTTYAPIDTRGDGVHVLSEVETQPVIRWFGITMSFRTLAIGLVVLPVAWLCVFLADRWPSRFDGVTRCRACGYDLRATPDRCPECGMVVKAT